MLRKIWNAAASVKTTFWLLSLAVLFFMIGTVYFRLERMVLPKMNFSLLQDWIREYGTSHPGLSWWLFILLFILFLLGVNTFACILERFSQLLPLRRRMGRLEFVVTLTPTVIHLLFLLILSGHLLSSFTGSVETLACNTGRSFKLAGDRHLKILDFRIQMNSLPEKLAGRPAGSEVDLYFCKNNEKRRFTVKMMAPVTVLGTSFHLDSFDKYARGPKMRLILRRDPGLRIIIPGLLVIIGLMAWYFPALSYVRRKSTISEVDP